MATIQKNSEIILEFAGFTCKITCARKAWVAYLKKRFDKSVFRCVSTSYRNKNRAAKLALVSPKAKSSELTFSFTFNPQTRCGRVRCTTSLFFFFPALHQALARIFSFLFFKNHGFVLHASCVIKNGRALLFTGVAGSGKSTLAQLSSPPHQILNDNDTFILKKKGRFYAFPSPFLESASWEDWKIDYRQGVKIHSLYLLQKAKKHQLLPADLPLSLDYLQHNIQFPLRPEILYDRTTKNQLQNLIFDFWTNTQVYLLRFKKDPQFWRQINETESNR